MYPAARELPYQPRIHRPEQDLALLSLLPCALHIIEQPFDLRARKICVRDKTGRTADMVGQTALHQPVHDVCGAAALPYDSVMNRTAGHFIPKDRRLPLIGNADTGHIGRGDIRRRKHFKHSRVLRRPDLHRILLNPSFMRIMLRQLVLTDCKNILFAVKKYCS